MPLVLKRILQLPWWTPRLAGTKTIALLLVPLLIALVECSWAAADIYYVVTPSADNPMPPIVQHWRESDADVFRSREELRVAVERAESVNGNRTTQSDRWGVIVDLSVAYHPATMTIPAGSWVLKSGDTSDWVKVMQGPWSEVARTGRPLSSPESLAWPTGLWGPAPVESPLPWLRVELDFPWLLEPYRPPESSEPQRITYESLYGDQRAELSGRAVSVDRWLTDGEHYLQNSGGTLWSVHAATGQRDRLYDPSRVAEAIVTEFGMDRQRAEQLADFDVQQLAPSARSAWLLLDGQLGLARLDGSQALRVPLAGSPAELMTYSDDEQQIAFIHANNLYVLSVLSGEVRQLSTDGSALVRNGKADWVYYEEVNLRDWSNFRWSPDSTRIVYLRLDDSPVGTFQINNDLGVLQQIETERYPLAGQPNPLVNLAVVDTRTGRTDWFDLDALGYSQDQILITGFGWSDDGQRVFVFVQDRAQKWLDLVFWTPGQRGERCLRQQTSAWVEPPLGPRFLSDGSFLLTSEASGWRHLYHYQADGTLIRPVTSGNWEVRSLERVDETAGVAYVTGTLDSSLEQHLYRVGIQQSGVERVTQGVGQHDVKVAVDGPWVIDRFSSMNQPERVVLRHLASDRQRVIDSNPVAQLEAYELPPLERFQIPARDGEPLEAALIRPPDGEPGHRAPLWITTYGGPHAPSVQESWHGGYLQDRLLAELGMAVLRIDPRSASGKGAVSTWTAYRQLGVQETQDLEDAVDWLVDQGIADPQHVGISGHSYGGFLTAFAMTHSTRFSAGIAGAPVTAWTNYDTIYTERYMDLPQNNPQGYANSSVVEAAGQLHGALLLIHGGLDDNVHLKNTLQLVDSLQRADKDFQLMIYPDHRHGIWGTHYRDLVLKFMCDQMGVERPAALSADRAGNVNGREH